MKKNKVKNIEYYLNLPWTYTIETTNETGETLYIVKVNELPYVATDAPSIDEAMKQIKGVMADIFKLALENNEEIIEPDNENLYKGNIAYRTSGRRHFLLSKEAKKRNISLSQLIDSYIDLSVRK